LYQRLLHRTADAAGRAFFAQLLGQGVSIEAIAAELAGSNEFFVEQGGGTNAGFLNALYQDTLGRPIDSGGLAWWTSRLAAGQSRTQVAAQILATDEYRAGVVQATYQLLLRRNADAAGLAHWVGVLRTGVSDQQFTAVIAGSDEYFAETA
ncbi:MAG TPA: DUF4214 domain-containing protein, partial [Pirellulales bacterium]|nr:DUF4214 domain-containing protein [Pirellulales bacterium]